jgi:hypothetical protein
LADLPAEARRAEQLQADIRARFSAETMTGQVLAAYRQALSAH